MVNLLSILEEGRKDIPHQIRLSTEHFTKTINDLNRQMDIMAYYMPIIDEPKAAVKMVSPA